MNLNRFLRRLIPARWRHLAAQGAVNQPVPAVTSSDVERVVRRDFPNEQFDVTIALLKESREPVRVQLAALKLANGSLEKLRTHIEVAKRDYRDVLAAAEYPSYFKIGFRVRELPDDERRQIIDSDCGQYEEWLRKRRNPQPQE